MNSCKIVFESVLDGFEMKRFRDETFLNIVSSILLQIVSAVSGFIIPRIILQYFGSEINGLITSLNQLIGYISLIEGGITGVITACLYQPLYEKDEKKISSIVATANEIYRKIGIVILIYSFSVGIIYPLVFHVSFSKLYILSLVLIVTISLLIQYFLSLTYRTLLNADKKVYVVSFSHIAVLILNTLLSYLSVKIYPSIHLFKLISESLFIIQPIVFIRYVSKHYKISKNAARNQEILKNRWNGFTLNIATMIHFGTNVTILNIFSDLYNVSIYGVYSLVTSGLVSLINAISIAMKPAIGQAYASGDTERIDQSFARYESVMMILIFVIFTITALLITPFVMIYTKSVNDADYYQPLFGVLLVISEGLYLMKLPHLDLTYAAKKFREIARPSFIEGAINIIVSSLLAKRWGLTGVIFGTICAMIYQLIFQIRFSSDILNRRQSVFYKKLLIMSCAAGVSVLLCRVLLSPVSYSVLSWVYHGALYSLITVAVFAILICIFMRDEFAAFLSLEKKKQ